MGGSVLVFLLAGAAGYAAGTLELVSRVDPSQFSDTAGGGFSDPSFGGDDVPFFLSLSAGGRAMAFVSRAGNLVPGQVDTNGGEDVFLADLATGTTNLVSRSPGSQIQAGNQTSGMTGVALSADGRYAAFSTFATDLTPGQAGALDAGQHLILADQTTGVSTLVIATKLPWARFADFSFSSDGRYLVFSSNASDLLPGLPGGESNPLYNVYLYDRAGRVLALVSHKPGLPGTAESGSSRALSMSADGRYVAFASTGNPANILLYDRTAGSSVMVGPGDTAVVSADGSYVAAGDARTVYLYASGTGSTTAVSSSPVSHGRGLGLSSDGRFLVFLRQDGAAQNAVLYDRASSTSTLLGPPPGVQSSRIAFPAISADGRYVAFASAGAGEAPSWDVFLFDRTAQTTTLVSHSAASELSPGNGSSSYPVLSANGARLVFASQATDLVAGVQDLNRGADLFSYEIATASLTLLTRRAPEIPSLSPLGANSKGRAMSSDGRYIAFESDSAHLVAGQADTNLSTDVFLYDRTTRQMILVSRSTASPATTGNGASALPAISADGRYVSFVSSATDLATGTPASAQYLSVYLFDRISGTTRFVARMETEKPFSQLQTRQQLSADGRWLAFTSTQPDVVPGQQGNGVVVFLWDASTGSTTLVSHSTSGPLVAANGQFPVLSTDDRYVAFYSSSPDLVPGQTDGGVATAYNVFLWDRMTGNTTLVSHAPSSSVVEGGYFGGLAMSSDGGFVLFVGPGSLDPSVPPPAGNGYLLYDRSLGTLQQIAAAPRNPAFAMSADARWVALGSDQALVPGVEAGLKEIYLYDRISRTFSLVTRAAPGSSLGSHGTPLPIFGVSADGRYTVFTSTASDLIPGEEVSPTRGGVDTYLFDRIAGTNTLLSHSPASTVEAVGGSEVAILSASGQQVAFTNFNDLTEDDLNLRTDVFVYSLDPAPPPGPVFPCTALNAPGLRSGVRQVFPVSNTCGVPATAKQVTVKVTVSEATGKGSVQLYPGNVTRKPPGTLSFQRRQTVSGTFKLPLATNGSGTLALLPTVASHGTVHVVVEVEGFIP